MMILRTIDKIFRIFTFFYETFEDKSTYNFVMKGLKDKFFFAILFAWVLHFGVNAQCQIDSKAFAPGEVIKYHAYYNWGFIWINAGEVEFKVTSKKYEGRDVYHLYGWGTSFKSYDWIFKVRQKYQSYIDAETLLPLWYERDVVEGTYTAFEEYKFDYANSQIRTYIQVKQNPAVTNSLPFSPCRFDVMSAIYYFRSVDFSKYRVGDRIPIDIVVDREMHRLYMRYLGKDEVETRDRKKHKCLKFAIQLVEGTIFKAGEEAVVWVTDDKNRVPVIVEAPILVGTVKAILADTKGLKH